MTVAATRRWLWILGTVALLVRCLLLDRNGLWHDEVATYDTAVLPAARIPAAAAEHSNSPPLYFWLVHAVLEVGGSSEDALRFPSVVAGALTIPALGLLIIEVTGSPAAGVLAAALLGVNPLHLWYSQEARSYALLTLCGALALLCCARALRTGAAAGWLGLGLWLLLALFIHPVGGSLLVVCWIWAALAPARRQAAKPLAVISVLVVLAAVAIVTMTPAHEHPLERPVSAVAELAYAAYTFLAGYSFGPGTRELQVMGARAALEVHWFQALLVVAVLVAMTALVARRTFPGRAQLLAAALVPPVMIILASRLTAFPFNVRYALPGLLGFLGLVAGALGLATGRWRCLGIATVLGLSLWSDVQWFTLSRYRKDDTRGAVQWLSSRIPAGAVVGIEPGYMIETFAHYGRQARPPLRVSRVAPDSAGMPLDSLQALAFTRFHHLGDWRTVEQAFIAGGLVIDSTDEVPGYHIVLLRHRPE